MHHRQAYPTTGISPTAIRTEAGTGSNAPTVGQSAAMSVRDHMVPIPAAANPIPVLMLPTPVTKRPTRLRNLPKPVMDSPTSVMELPTRESSLDSVVILQVSANPPTSQ